LTGKEEEGTARRAVYLVGGEDTETPRRERFTTEGSVSIPVSSNSSRMPGCVTPSGIAFWSALAGNSACWPAGTKIRGPEHDAGDHLTDAVHNLAHQSAASPQRD
jgi:hypothetical protein